jgi:hypothetical protein
MTRPSQELKHFSPKAAVACFKRGEPGTLLLCECSQCWPVEIPTKASSRARIGLKLTCYSIRFSNDRFETKCLLRLVSIFHTYIRARRHIYSHLSLVGVPPKKKQKKNITMSVSTESSSMFCTLTPPIIKHQLSMCISKRM